MSGYPMRPDEDKPTTYTYGRIDDLNLEATITQVLDRWPCAGLAVGVVTDGNLTWFHGHGLADVAAKTPITEDTVFRIGSITKTFTAVAVMQLWEKGLIDLDAPANYYLQTFRLLLRQLLLLRKDGVGPVSVTSSRKLRAYE
jgi:CubicO group peptidase (beta-lactamase class C family)